jgi:hypothetical protein
MDRVADGPDHWYCFYNIAAGDQAVYHSAMQYLDDATSMYRIYTPSCGTSTDIWFIDNPNIDPQYNAITVCVATIGASKTCDAWWVGVDYGNLYASSIFWPGYFMPYNVGLVWMARHEIGHTTGLSHSSSSAPYGANNAMYWAYPPDAGGFNYIWGLYSPHDVNCHLNPQYGGTSPYNC